MDAQRPDDTRTDAGFEALWSSDGVTRSLAPTATGVPADLPFLFSAGQHFGPYLIVRPIGKGGMGQVYETEETESGRRIAVKILSRGLGDEEERERFLQEGRLAASLSHPNTVYVFGTTEVQGFPVIAMELAPSGTLKDLVVPGSSLAPARAVDAVLQVIAGLEAAQTIGILHRDIKPSNCFVAANGRVLVGDFGLSIAAHARAETTGVILGTPGFASPEQLRGASLDVRSDIYSVGATLYYLLAGKAPFDDPDLQTMMTRVASEPPPALALSRPDLPRRLTALVTKCLAKKPADRYATYAALRSALEPFRSAALTPAPLARRVFAGAVDGYVATLPAMPITMYLGAAVLDLSNPRALVWSMVLAVGSSILYFSILEGRFGCGAGKAMFNLRVVNAAETAPGFPRAFVRTMAFVLPAQVTRLVLAFYITPLAQPGVADTVTQALLGATAIVVSLAVFAIQFSTIRRRNGFAALHDLASGTRVVLRPRSMEVRKAAIRSRRNTAAAFDGDRVGPYLVPRGSFARVRAAAAPVVVEGFDDRLRRPVWVEMLPEGSAPVPAARRDLSRPGRTRWLSGRRQGGDCWDAYEAFEGVSLKEAIRQPQPWGRVRHWIADLASEIVAAAADGTLPPLDADRVWIDADDRVRLLDLVPGPPSTPDQASRFLYRIAVGALKGKDPDTVMEEPPGVPLPLGARAFLLSLRDAPRYAPQALAQAPELLRMPAEFTRGRRAAQIAVCAFIPILMPIGVVVALRAKLGAEAMNPRAYQFDVCVNQLAAYEKKGDANLTPQQRQNRESIEIFIAEYLQDEVKESAAVARSFPIVTIRTRGEGTLAARAVARHKTRTPQEVKRADEVVARALENNSANLSFLAQWGVALTMTAGSAGVVAVVALIGALVTRAGFTLRSVGAALVTVRGEPATRVRALWRAAVTWAPVGVVLLLMRLGPKVQDMTLAGATLQTIPLVLFAAGAAWAIKEPSRGIQDRLARTRIVPR